MSQRRHRSPLSLLLPHSSSPAAAAPAIPMSVGLLLERSASCAEAGAELCHDARQHMLLRRQLLQQQEQQPQEDMEEGLQIGLRMGPQQLLWLCQNGSTNTGTETKRGSTDSKQTTATGVSGEQGGSRGWHMRSLSTSPTSPGDPQHPIPDVLASVSGAADGGFVSDSGSSCTSSRSSCSSRRSLRTLSTSTSTSTSSSDHRPSAPSASPTAACTPNSPLSSSTGQAPPSPLACHDSATHSVPPPQPLSPRVLSTNSPVASSRGTDIHHLSASQQPEQQQQQQQQLKQQQQQQQQQQHLQAQCQRPGQVYVRPACRVAAVPPLGWWEDPKKATRGGNAAVGAVSAQGTAIPSTVVPAARADAASAATGVGGEEGQGSSAIFEALREKRKAALSARQKSPPPRLYTSVRQPTTKVSHEVMRKEVLAGPVASAEALDAAAATEGGGEGSAATAVEVLGEYWSHYGLKPPPPIKLPVHQRASHDEKRRVAWDDREDCGDAAAGGGDARAPSLSAAPVDPCLVTYPKKGALPPMGWWDTLEEESGRVGSSGFFESAREKRRAAKEAVNPSSASSTSPKAAVEPTAALSDSNPPDSWNGAGGAAVAGASDVFAPAARAPKAAGWSGSMPASDRPSAAAEDSVPVALTVLTCSRSSSPQKTPSLKSTPPPNQRSPAVSGGFMALKGLLMRTASDAAADRDDVDDRDDDEDATATATCSGKSPARLGLSRHAGSITSSTMTTSIAGNSSSSSISSSSCSTTGGRSTSINSGRTGCNGSLSRSRSPFGKVSSKCEEESSGHKCHPGAPHDEDESQAHDEDEGQAPATIEVAFARTSSTKANWKGWITRKLSVSRRASS